MIKEWSQKYYGDLDYWKHCVNNTWFHNMLCMLKPDGVLFVPNLNKSFNKDGEEV